MKTYYKSFNKNKPTVTVIIATMNRVEALRTISLPSLLHQTYTDFEVIVWDASSNVSFVKVCIDVFIKKFNDSNIDLQYYSAPRRGSASQRNDAVKFAKGKIITFFDDDSEVSPDGIESIVNTFNNNLDTYGVGLHLKQDEIYGCHISRIFKLVFYSFFMLYLPINKRVVLSSGFCVMPIKDRRTSAEWLSGCSMSFRKDIFSTLHFDERLEFFGGYASYEDVLLSYQVKCKYQKDLLVCNDGYVVHHHVIGGRTFGINKIAAYFFNRYIVCLYKKSNDNIFAIPCFIWSSVGYYIVLIIYHCLIKKQITIKELNNGVYAAYKAIINI